MFVYVRICICECSYGVMCLCVHAHVCSNARMICVYVCVCGMCVYVCSVCFGARRTTLLMDSPWRYGFQKGEDKPLPVMCLEAQRP